MPKVRAVTDRRGLKGKRLIGAETDDDAPRWDVSGEEAPGWLHKFRTLILSLRELGPWFLDYVRFSALTS